MIDLHIHILPGVDDGSPSMDTSLAMAEIAASTGVDTIIMTPHCNIPEYYNNYYSPTLLRAFANLRKELIKNKIPVQVFPGMEIFCTPDIGELIENHYVIGLNFSDYLLVECGFDTDPDWMTDRLQEMIQMGKIPIVAHPERYDCICESPETALTWARMGCLLQSNKGSFLGRFGRPVEKTAHTLLEHRLVSFIASDAHRPDVRTPDMEEIRSYIACTYSDETVARLMHDNPLRVCKNEPITPESFIPFEARRFWRL